METIITIDFDVIMWPSIELYNHFIEGEKDEILNIERFAPLIKYADADLELYRKLTNYLINNPTKFIFINNHDEALNYINNPCCLINIDHHHDLGYNKLQWKNNEITCGNWVYKGLEQNKILNYIWAHGPTSMPFEGDKKTNIIEMDVLKLDFNKLLKPNKIIICASYPWITTQFKPLFELWKNILKGDKND